MEILFSVLRVLLEEQSKKGVDVFTSSDSVADRATAIGEASVDGLVQEYDRGVVVP